MSAMTKPIPGGKTPTPLKTHRFLCGLTQAAVAKAIGTDLPRFSRLENDLLRDTASTVRLKGQLAELFGVPVAELFPKGGQGD